MGTYAISYDLRAPHRDYEPVWAYLRALPSNWHALSHTWFVVSPKSVAELRDDLHELIDIDDRLVIVRINGSAWATNARLMGGRDWLHTHVSL